MLSEDDNLSFSRKIIAGGLIIFAFLLLGMWFWQFNQTVNSGFEIAQNGQEAGAGDNCPDGECGDADPANRDKDTDGDGLSDWEEKNVHNTSPYLEDTDGDGIPDKEEIEQGTDPNCPEGEECEDSTESVTSQEGDDFGSDKGTQGTMIDRMSTSTSPTSSAQRSLEAQDISAENVDQELLKGIMKGDADADKLRRVLVEAGMDKEIVGQISDEELIKSYKQSLNKIDQ